LQQHLAHFKGIHQTPEHSIRTSQLLIFTTGQFTQDLLPISIDISTASTINRHQKLTRMQLTINDKIVSVDVDPRMPLLWVLRDELNLTGTKYGCGVGNCGACTVLIDGQAKRSCTVPAVNGQHKAITTIEHLEQQGQITAVQQAWIAQQADNTFSIDQYYCVVDCGTCVNPDTPTDEQIDQFMTNICRCGTYPRIRKAIRMAAALLSNNATLALEQNLTQ